MANHLVPAEVTNRLAMSNISPSGYGFVVSGFYARKAGTSIHFQFVSYTSTYGGYHARYGRTDNRIK